MLAFIRILISLCILFSSTAFSQSNSLVNTSNSPYALLHSVDMGDVQWTKGFWAERFAICKDSMVPNLWRIYNDEKISHAFKNFEIAAGLDTGSHQGPSFHDGDFYKTLEAVASVFASTKDKRLETMMDKAIDVIRRSQRDDGYIYTKAVIDQRKTGLQKQFEDRLSFEAYNIGHLMTAACVHYRATGKTNLLNIAKKASDYLYNFYKQASPTLARNAICPSHYMGTIEMYRTTKEPRYLELAKHLIDIKGNISDGTDDNQDRIPFREQSKAMGHAVRANYLYAGVADVYAESGDTSLLNRLDLIWHDVVQHKMYITGGCGSVYDGVSPDGTSYNPADVQKTHQAYGRDYQLPNFTAHNETCANIGNLLWNWRMLQLTGHARYTDVVELVLYNSILSGIDLGGKNFLYTNPLAYSEDLPFKQRWSKQRVGYISLSNCCPPNVVRTIAEVSNYAYGISQTGVWIHLYGGNRLSTVFNGEPIKLMQETSYPWDETINVTVEAAPSKNFSIFLRIPGWCNQAKLSINGKEYETRLTAGQYVEINRTWKKDDKIKLVLTMPVKLMEANPLVEETRNQVAVKRGPVVYCMESSDLGRNKIFDIGIPASIVLTPEQITIGNSRTVSLVGRARLIHRGDWSNELYKEISKTSDESIAVRLIPYYAWGNRGFGDMQVWMPVIR